jgi:hypothetical protein
MYIFSAMIEDMGQGYGMYQCEYRKEAMTPGLSLPFYCVVKHGEIHMKSSSGSANVYGQYGVFKDHVRKNLDKG